MMIKGTHEKDKISELETNSKNENIIDLNGHKLI
jgi:hypothetical protein